jgi:hypothetical protein
MKILEEVEQQELGRRKQNEPVIIRVPSGEFQAEVLEKLGRLETKIDMLVGDHQPGRMTLAEQRITTLEKSEIKRGVYDRLVSAAISVCVSAAIAMHDHLGIR